MYSNNKLIYDDKVEAERLYTNGFNNEFTWRKVKLVAMYMRYELGYGKAKIKNQLILFCTKQEPAFNYVSVRKTLNSIVNLAMRKEYKLTLPVSIRKSEIEAIRKIKNFKQQKILLAMLFLLKQTPTNKGITVSDFGKIRLLVGKRNLPNSEIQKLLGFLWSAGYIGEPRGYYPLNFISNRANDEIILKIDNTDGSALALIPKYIEYCGGEMGYCKTCSAEFVRASRHHLYCTEHSKENIKKSWKNASSRYRNKSS